MKNLITIIVLLALSNMSYCQNYAVLRYGSTNSSSLSVGDTVLVPVYCDDISNALFLGLQTKLSYDEAVLSWPGNTGNITDGVTGFNPVVPYGIAWSFNYMPGTGITAFWNDPNFTGVTLSPGDVIFNYVFLYQGGETTLPFGQNSYIGDFTTYLVDGCICDSIQYPAIFHITTNGSILQNASIEINGQSATSDDLGMAIFPLPSGDYTYLVAKDGYESSFGEFSISESSEIIYVDLDLANGIGTSGKDGFSLYPNPSTGICYVNLPENMDYVEYYIKDINGKEIQNGIFTNVSTETINLANYGKGIYFIFFVSDSARVVKKLIVR